MGVEGVINLFKPVRAGSARYVYRLRRILGERRVGHAGTLDPFAEGVLLGCVGKATRLVERLMSLGKEYETELRLGVTNATFDPEQPLEPVPAARAPEVTEIEATLQSMRGVIEQSPPVHSAIKLGGVPAYLRARSGEPVVLAARPVRIDQIELLEFAWPMLRLRITCGRGTYIRAVARDLGARWGCGAVCMALRRTRVGPFAVENAVNLNSTPPEGVRAALLSVEDVVNRIEPDRQPGPAVRRCNFM